MVSKSVFHRLPFQWVQESIFKLMNLTIMKKYVLRLTLLLLLSSNVAIGMNGDTILFSTPDMTANTGDYICVPITIENFRDVLSMQFGVTFDPEILEYQGITLGVISDLQYGDNDANRGLLRFLWLDSQLSPLSLEDGALLAEICFVVVSPNTESTSVMVSDEALPVEIIDANDDMTIPYSMNAGSIDIINLLDCGLVPFCTDIISMDYSPGMTIEPADLIDDFQYMLECYGLNEEDIRLLDLNDPNGELEQTIIIDCDNLRTAMNISVLQPRASGDTLLYIAICRSEIELTIGPDDQSCIKIEVACTSPYNCVDMTIDVDSAYTYIAFADLVQNIDSSCILGFTSQYSSIAHDAFVDDDFGFYLNCDVYTESIPIDLQNLKVFDNGATAIIEVCSSVITLQNFEDHCVIDIPLRDTFPITLINASNIGLTLNDVTLEPANSSLFLVRKDALLDIPNILEVSDNEPTLNGISTLDFVMTYKGIFGEELTGPQAIASDVDLNGSITTKDLIEVREVILGIKQPEHMGKLFLVESRTDFNSIDIFDFSNHYISHQFEAFDVDPQEGLLFHVYAYGDLNQSHSALSKSQKTEPVNSSIHMEDQFLLKNHSYIIPVTINDGASIIAAAANLTLNNAIVSTIKHNYTGQAFEYHIMNPQEVNLLFFDPTGHKELTFNLEITPLESGMLSDMISIGTYNTPEMVHTDLSTALLEIAWASTLMESKVCAYPNPTASTLTIDVPQQYLGGQLHMYNVLGAQLYSETILSTHTTIEITQFSKKGIVLVKVENETDSETFKIHVE